MENMQMKIKRTIVDRFVKKTAGCGKVSDSQKIEERKDKL